MVDIIALAVSHGLLALAVWRLAWRPDLDLDGARPRPDKASHAVRRGKGGDEDV